MEALREAMECGDCEGLYDLIQKTEFDRETLKAAREEFYENPEYGFTRRETTYSILLDVTLPSEAFAETMRIAKENDDVSLLLQVINHYRLDRYKYPDIIPDMSLRICQLNFSPDIPNDLTRHDFMQYGEFRQSRIRKYMRISVSQSGIDGHLPSIRYAGFFNI